MTEHDTESFLLGITFFYFLLFFLVIVTNMKYFYLQFYLVVLHCTICIYLDFWKQWKIIQRPIKSLYLTPNLTDELSRAKERRLNQFGTAVLVWCAKSVKFDRVCRTFVELNLGSTHGAPSESDDAPVSLQSRTYSIRFGTWKIPRLNSALVIPRSSFTESRL